MPSSAFCKGLANRAAMFASIATLTIAVAGSAAGTTAGATASPVFWPFDPVAVDRFVTNQMARHRIPGLAPAITYGDQVVHVRGYGEAKDGVPVTGQTQFRIASLSKSFTALAVGTPDLMGSFACVDGDQALACGIA